MFTTPPRPFDLEQRFPVLADWRRTATRLHPRPGEPGVRDSSVGGPLLWPAEEPWPVCTAGDHYDDPTTTVGHVLRERLMSGKRGIAVNRGDDLTAIDAEWSAMIADGTKLAASLDPDGPFPYIPVAQLYTRDVPDLPVPPGTDVAQLLWCPFQHEHCGYLPAVRVVWRDSSTVTALADGPGLDVPVEDEGMVPQPCVVHPEPVVEYAPMEFTGIELPEDDEDDSLDNDVDYIGDLMLAAGWKAGGWGDYCGVADPVVPDCECGAPTEAYLTVGNGEWGGGYGDFWRPIEDADFTPTPLHPTGSDPVQTFIGRGYVMQLFKCAKGFDCPITTLMT